MTLEQLLALAKENKLSGFYPEIDDSIYHHADCPGISSSYWKTLISATPEHAEAYRKQKGEDHEALIIGRAFHELTEDSATGLSRFTKKFCVIPEGMRRDARNKDYQAFLAENEGRQVLTRTQWDMVHGMRDSVMKHPRTKMLEGTMVEHSGWWYERDVLCKFRPDFYHQDGIVFDLKSSGSRVNPYSFSKSIHDWGYQISAAVYLRGISHLVNTKVKHFVLIAVEKTPPYGVIFYDLDEAALEKGNQDFDAALEIYKRCLEKGEFPGYPQDFVSIGLPHYAYSLSSERGF